jgi:hypothetical protein
MGLLFFLLPSEEDQIRKQFAVLADHIGKTSDEHQLIAAAKAKRVRAVFSDRFTFHAPAYDYHRELDAAELPALILSATAPYSELSLSFHDLTFRFPTPDLAQVRATSRVRGRLSGGEWIEDIQELNCRWRIIDDRWRLEAVEVVEVLQK